MTRRHFLHTAALATATTASFAADAASDLRATRGIAVEYELHAMGELLSRELYYKDPTLFRMVASGRRNPDANCNPLEFLCQNINLFGAQTAQVLEYWLDVSLFSKYTRPAVQLPWREDICRADVTAYRTLGVQHITSFATWIDADYVQRHGDPQPFLDEYGQAFRP